MKATGQGSAAEAQGHVAPAILPPVLTGRAWPRAAVFSKSHGCVAIRNRGAWRVGGWLRLVCLAASCAGVGARGAEVTVSADVASAHVFRGETVNADWVLQPGAVFSAFPLPLEVGIWGNLDLSADPPTLEAGQFSRLDLYALYYIPVPDTGLLPSVGFREYLSPVSDAPADREFSLGLSTDLPLSPAARVHYGIDGAMERDGYAELTLGRTWDLAPLLFDLCLGIGYRRPREGPSGFSHAWTTIEAVYPVLSASLTLLHQLDDAVLPDSRFDVRIVGRLGARLTF